MAWKTYTVKKGFHYSAHIPHLHWEVSRLVFDFIFDESCIYNLGSVDQFDWNKVYGVGFGFSHHKDSYRIGSRWDNLSGKMQLAHYSYNHSVRSYVDMCAVELNQQCQSYITFDRDANCISNVISVFNNAEPTVIYNNSVPFDFKNVPTWGFMLYPYFGGNEAAVSDYTVKINRIR